MYLQIETDTTAKNKHILMSYFQGFSCDLRCRLSLSGPAAATRRGDVKLMTVLGLWEMVFVKQNY